MTIKEGSWVARFVEPMQPTIGQVVHIEKQKTEKFLGFVYLNVYRRNGELMYRYPQPFLMHEVFEIEEPDFKKLLQRSEETWHKLIEIKL